jgi:hypothetical protein
MQHKPQTKAYTCRKDLPDHMIVLNERCLKKLLSEFVHYYHEDRTQVGLNKELQPGRSAQTIRTRAKIAFRFVGLCSGILVRLSPLCVLVCACYRRIDIYRRYCQERLLSQARQANSVLYANLAKPFFAWS